MQFQNVSILSVAHVDAPHHIPSSQIEAQLAPVLSRFGMPPHLLEELTGIKTRRFWDNDVQPSEVATQAAERALESAGIDREKIGVLISTSVCKDYIEPSVASLVHGNLKLSDDCMNFDVGNACLAFINGIQIASNMIERGQIDYALIVDGEGSRFIIEQTIEKLLNPDIDERYFRANFATLTLGSGAAAMILTHSDLAPEGHRVLGGVTKAATEHSRLCYGQLGEMATDASALLIAGLSLVHKTIPLYLKELNITVEDIDHWIIHQVSQVHTNKIIEMFNIVRDRVYLTYPDFGNVGPAAIPIALSKAMDDGLFKRGDKITLGGIGSGVNCSIMGLEW